MLCLSTAGDTGQVWSPVSAHCGVDADEISITFVDKNDSHPNAVSLFIQQILSD